MVAMESSLGSCPAAGPEAWLASRYFLIEIIPMSAFQASVHETHRSVCVWRESTTVAASLTPFQREPRQSADDLIFGPHLLSARSHSISSRHNPLNDFPEKFSPECPAASIPFATGASSCLPSGFGPARVGIPPASSAMVSPKCRL